MLFILMITVIHLSNNGSITISTIIVVNVSITVNNTYNPIATFKIFICIYISCSVIRFIGLILAKFFFGNISSTPLSKTTKLQGDIVLVNIDYPTYLNI